MSSSPDQKGGLSPILLPSVDTTENLSLDDQLPQPIATSPKQSKGQNMVSQAPENDSDADYGIISPSPILLVLTDAQDAAGKTLRTNDVSEDINVAEPPSRPALDIQDNSVWFDANPMLDDNDGDDSDLLDQIPTMFRLLNLLYETGSAGQGGLVEKIIIDQESLGAFLNRLLPGSYHSISNIDFKALDSLTIKPKGVYGNRSEVAKFLLSIHVINEPTARLLSRSDEEVTPTSPMLRSGLYLALPPNQETQGEYYLVYWPEDTTWCDGANTAVQRNRVTFMRYLTQLSDQIISPVSKEQAELFVWDSGSHNPEASAQEDDVYGDDDDDDERMFTFEVQKSEDQEENVTAKPGFKVDPSQRMIDGKTVKLIGGETRAGLLLALVEEPQKHRTQLDEDYPSVRLRTALSNCQSTPIILENNLTDDQLHLLTENGLREKYSDLFGRYDARLAEAFMKRGQELESKKSVIWTQLQEELPEIKQHLRNIVRKDFRVLRRYAFEQTSAKEAQTPNLDKYPSLLKLASGLDKHPPMTDVPSKRFQELKMRISIIAETLYRGPKRTKDEQQAIIKDVLDEPLEDLKNGTSSGKSALVWLKSGFEAIFPIVGSKDKDTSTNVKNQWNNTGTSDLEFLRRLNDWVQTYPTLFELGQEVTKSLQDHLSEQEEIFLQMHLDTTVIASQRSREGVAAVQAEATYKSNWSHLWTELWSSVRKAMQPDASFQCVISIRSITVLKQGRRPSETIYRVKGTRIESTPKRTRYAFHPLELTQQDIQQCQSDNTYVPQPIIRTTAQFDFKLEEGRRIEFIRPLQDRCLIIVASRGESRIFMNRYPEVEQAIHRRGSKSVLNHDRLGGTPMYAYDEATRTLAVCHGEEGPKITWFTFDENFLSLKNRGTIQLHTWYETPVRFDTMCFMAGSTELCLIDSAGCARVLSLVSEQFGPASLQIDAPIQGAFSAPDGSCLFVATGDPVIRGELRAFHWTSFGPESEGFRPASVDPGSSSLIMSFERGGQIYWISMSLTQPHGLTSTALQVKQKSSRFDIKSKETGPKAEARRTVNNCLIDCHMEVWSRFPVLPAVPRNTLVGGVREPRSITFISDGNFSGAKDYFAKLVSAFERVTEKPTNGKLFAISVHTSNQPFIASKQGVCSYFHLGSFVVELLCLIPIQLAITRENSFIPLKDGVLNPAFEKRLLGADVPTIINSLSVGWYESLFRSYMATKPIRVVSSMGEQSVGKSYCLNHFADTSFAGSAMRTTEGVWLSCTPTDDYLLVCLDFEGVQSIERSAQEDTLLVLFNAAVSNMVLFRNNFAISRNIAGLFKSFQSSAMVLDPQLNPGLFNSDLAIIIKDVLNSDSREIVREFKQKFQSIVREEQDQNFITRLHRGKLHILPWPVIKSRGFYTLFQRVRSTLETQPFTHGGGGVFLHTLKTLMAKIKANDWGALDQNLAAHRAQQLAEWLPDAICRGGIEYISGMWSPMKDLDTDQEVPASDPVSDDVFWAPRSQGESLDNGEVAVEQFLAALVKKHGERLSAWHTNPEKHISILQDHLYSQFDQRIGQVRDWIMTNVRRFPPENQDIRDLFKALDNMILTARAALQICASKCSACHLLCLRPYRHSNKNDHDCGTDHHCPFSCEVGEEHFERTRCGLPSGHDGRHLCKAGRHTCGQPCSLADKSGCEYTCVKDIDHADGHLCSTRVHFCGKPCDLQNVPRRPGGLFYNCPGFCQIAWDQEHERHACVNSQLCPIECQLCPRLCSNTDHFHGLEPESVHLCGQEHRCTMPCEAPGICQIETQPSAIIEKFKGRFEEFQYTRYSQEKRRLTCAVPIDPGQLKHEGLHTHSTADIVFHFCDVQCPRCKYYCTLPLGHPQQLHETSHGSMTETQWHIEGPASSASYELQDHKYGSGDQGSTVLCSLVCTQQGRHVHVDYCRSDDAKECSGEEYQHINEKILPHPDMPKDWISHSLFWARSGFKDPYARNEQIEFAKCDAYCPAPEHKATPNNPAIPSYCKLPILHAPVASTATPRSGYISQDGHVFDCQDPTQRHQDYHIVFVIDSSSSMLKADRKPLPNTPISERLRTECNNRYGAVLSALHAFWLSREPRSTARPQGSSRPRRTDAYSIITFSDSAVERVSNSFSSTAERLIERLLPQQKDIGTNFTAAIEKAQAVIQRHWNNQRAPIVIFLSDGAGTVSDETISGICRHCAQLGTPLAFYTISFGSGRTIRSLQQMAQVAHNVFQEAQRGRRNSNSSIPCSYVNALDSIALATRFLDIANSLQKPRASLIGSYNNRLQSSVQ